MNMRIMWRTWSTSLKAKLRLPSPSMVMRTRSPDVRMSKWESRSGVVREGTCTCGEGVEPFGVACAAVVVADLVMLHIHAVAWG